MPYVRLRSLPAGRCFITGPETRESTAEAAAAAAEQAAATWPKDESCASHCIRQVTKTRDNTAAAAAAEQAAVNWLKDESLTSHHIMQESAYRVLLCLKHFAAATY
jgi:hypothetical protein